MSDMDDARIPAGQEEATREGIDPNLSLLDDTGSAGSTAEVAISRRGNGGRRPHQDLPLRRVLEAILFATDRPVTVEQMLTAVPDRTPEELETALEEISRDYLECGYGFQLLRSGGGWVLQTDPELHEVVTRFLEGKKRTRLSRASMETLAIVSYRQPITRGEIEELRGVDCGQVLHTLLDRDLITVKGRSQALGRPLLYGTTIEFLHYFGINSLADLPSPEELESLLGDDPLEDPDIQGALRARGLLSDEGDGEGAAMAAEGDPERDGNGGGHGNGSGNGNGNGSRRPVGGDSSESGGVFAVGGDEEILEAGSSEEAEIRSMESEDGAEDTVPDEDRNHAAPPPE